MQNILRFFAILLGLIGCVAQQAHAFQPTPLSDSANADRAKNLITRFFKRASDQHGFHPDSISFYAIGEMQQFLQKRGAEPFWQPPLRYSVGSVLSIRQEQSVAIVTATTTVDSLPWFGPMTVDWVFFIHEVEKGEWRISELRRVMGVEPEIETLRYLDTTSVFPATLKPIVARDVSGILLSNAQLREHFNANRATFTQLAGEFHKGDSLTIISRKDKQVEQLNFRVIMWDVAAQEIPQETIDEYMQTALPEQREAFQANLRYAERLRKQGRDTLRAFAQEAGYTMERLDRIVKLMYDTRITFINAGLNWKEATLFTIAGKNDDAMGYLYSPEGELPYISPLEYFYLEDLGDGWWIFRST